MWQMMRQGRQQITADGDPVRFSHASVMIITFSWAITPQNA
jgi:hypothetical protein